MLTGIRIIPDGAHIALWNQKVEIRLNLEKLQRMEQIACHRLAADARRAECDADHQQRLRQRQEVDRQKQAFAVGMRDAGVDVARWLVARYQYPDRLIPIDARDAVQLQVLDR